MQQIFTYFTLSSWKCPYFAILEKFIPMQSGEKGTRGWRPVMVQQAAMGCGGWRASGWVGPFRRGFIKENKNTWADSSFLQSV